MSSDPGAREAPCGIVRRVSATPAAQALIERLRAVHGPLMFHQSGGCCDGSAPMCFALGEFQTGDADVCSYDDWNSHPSYNVPNFHRIVVHGSTVPLEWLKISVDPAVNAPRGPNAFGPFAWTRMIQM